MVTKIEGAGDDNVDTFVPDPQVWRELGVTSMTGWRWSHDDRLNFPRPIQIRGRNYRSRRQLEDFKARLLRQAIATRRRGGVSVESVRG
jgi:predicted DNA-binding transcriptional regulator AlpA